MHQGLREGWRRLPQKVPLVIARSLPALDCSSDASGIIVAKPSPKASGAHPPERLYGRSSLATGVRDPGTPRAIGRYGGQSRPSDVSSARNHRALAGTTKLGAPTLLLHPCLPEYTCGRKLADNLRPPKNPR